MAGGVPLRTPRFDSHRRIVHAWLSEGGRRDHDMRPGGGCASSHAMICGHTWACARRPTRIARCCRHVPLSPAYSIIRAPPAGAASTNGLIEAGGATSAAVFTTATVGTDRLAGPTDLPRTCKAPR